eukprot:SAG31_NODE_1299_length_8918_cov_59.994671_2_plen_127_part_00
MMATPTLQASRSGSYSISRSTKGSAELLDAVSAGDYAAVEALLQAGEDANSWINEYGSRDAETYCLGESYGLSALHLAAARTDKGLMDLLISNGAKEDATASYNVWCDATFVCLRLVAHPHGDRLR